MKLLLPISLGFALLGGLSASAHNNRATSLDPVMDLGLSQRARTMTQMMIPQLHLNEGEYVHLRSVHRILLYSLDGINTEFANNPDLRRAKLQELQGYYEQERVRVLNRTQLSQLQEQPVHDALPVIDLNSGGLG